MDDFVSFTREKIARLKSEIEALEKNLKDFEISQARKTGAARRSGGDQPRSGAFGVIMAAVNNAGVEGMTLDEMTAAAAVEGYEVKRNTLRSQVWSAKEAGDLTSVEPGRYRSSAFDELAGAPPKPSGPRETFTADLDDEIPF